MPRSVGHNKVNCTILSVTAPPPVRAASGLQPPGDSCLFLLPLILPPTPPAPPCSSGVGGAWGGEMEKAECNRKGALLCSSGRCVHYWWTLGPVGNVRGDLWSWCTSVSVWHEPPASVDTVDRSVSCKAPGGDSTQSCPSRVGSPEALSSGRSHGTLCPALVARSGTRLACLGRRGNPHCAPFLVLFTSPRRCPGSPCCMEASPVGDGREGRAVSQSLLLPFRAPNRRVRLRDSGHR